MCEPLGGDGGVRVHVGVMCTYGGDERASSRNPKAAVVSSTRSAVPTPAPFDASTAGLSTALVAARPNISASTAATAVAATAAAAKIENKWRVGRLDERLFQTPFDAGFELDLSSVAISI